MTEFYGPRFYFRQFLRVRNALVGAVFHVGLMAGLGLLLIPFVRGLVKKFVYAPGTGPRREDGANDRVEYRAVATADQQSAASPKRALGKLVFEGNMYALTGLLLGEAGRVILNNEEKVKRVSRCGIVTPATLGQEFVNALEKVGCVVETQVLEN